LTKYKRLKDSVTNIFVEFHSNPKNLNKELDNDLILKKLNDTELSQMYKKISVRKLFEDSNINPLCIMSHIRWTRDVDRIYVCKNIIKELDESLGFENLNDNSMNSNKLVDLPLSLEKQFTGNKTYTLSEKLKVRPKKITLQSIYKRCMDVTGQKNWRDVLTTLDFNVEKVERKKSKFSKSETLELFIKYKKKKKYKNIYKINQDDIRIENHSLWKLILRYHNHLNYDIKKYSEFFTGLFCLEYFENEGGLPPKSEMLNENTEQKFFEFLTYQTQVRWELYPEFLQDIVLKMYVRGSSIYGEENRSDVEKRVFDKIRHWKGKKSKDIYKNSGILINNLQNIKSIIDCGYDRKDIYDKLRFLMDKTLKTGVNHLSKEYIIKNEKEFMNSCFKVERITTNNWSKVLEIYGINPDLFLPDRIDVSNRGIIFEKLIKDLFEEHLTLRKNRSSLRFEHDFWYKKKQGNCIPDFTFKNFIVDTKFSIGISKKGFHHQQLDKQFKNFKKLKKKIIILTLNQKKEELSIDNVDFIIINLKHLKHFLEDQFSVKIFNYEIKYIFDEVNKIKFFRKYLS